MSSHRLSYSYKMPVPKVCRTRPPFAGLPIPPAPEIHSLESNFTIAYQMTEYGPVMWDWEEKVLIEDFDPSWCIFGSDNISSTICVGGDMPDIPDEATMKGFKVFYTKRGIDENVIWDYRYELVNNYEFLGVAKEPGETWPGVRTAFELGGDDDLWGWLPVTAAVKSGMFGFAITIQAMNVVPPRVGSANIDYMKMVYYYID